MPKLTILAASAAIALCVPLGAARGLDPGFPPPLVSGGLWVVTIGAYGGAGTPFPGGQCCVASGRPIVDIYQLGDSVWLSFPTDAFGLTLFSSGDLRFGFAGDYITNRSSRDYSALRGLPGINYTGEAGAFGEYYPFPFIRTRIELLQGISGAEGFEARFILDYTYAPGPEWLFTAGPRLKLVNTQYQSVFFSVDTLSSKASGLPAYHASGGFNAAGIALTARYDLTGQVSVRAFTEWDRLLDDAAESPIVRLKGSTGQFQFGLGATYRLTYAP